MPRVGSSLRFGSLKTRGFVTTVPEPLNRYSLIKQVNVPSLFHYCQLGVDTEYNIKLQVKTMPIHLFNVNKGREGLFNQFIQW